MRNAAVVVDRQPAVPALPDTPRSPYSPGPLRAVTDEEHALVETFLELYPQYQRLSHFELVTLAATYRDDEDQAMRDALEAEGVPSDWHRPNEGDE
jgi:hypothetical protein